MIQRVADLQFDEAALFFDDQDEPFAAGEIAQALGFQRPGHADLVNRELRMAVEAHAFQRVQRVLMRFTDGDQADRRVRLSR